MRDFFSSIRFKILAFFLLFLIGVMAYTSANGRLSSAPQDIFSVMLVPVQKVTAGISNATSNVLDKYFRIESILSDNERLEQELADTRNKLIDYDEIKFENEQLRQAFKLQEDNPSFSFVQASVLSRDSMAKFYSFTIDQGSKDGVMIEAPVISPQGVVGKVIEVGYNYSKVVTLLDPTVNIGGMVSSTRDNGIVTSDALLSQRGKCKLTYLSRDSMATQGDIIITTGLGGIFPQGLDVGTIEDIIPEDSGTTLYAVVEPAVDIENVKMVFVITDFEIEEDISHDTSTEGSDEPSPDEDEVLE